MSTFVTRPCSLEVADRLARQGVHPALARVFAARGISDITELSTDLSGLLPPATLTGAGDAATLLADAIAAGKNICIIADYDCDGATACAVALLGLGMMGAKTSFLVPNRFDNGYGLTPQIVHEAKERHDAGVLVTVDNGIASIDGVRKAVSLGMEVLVTDHHLPGESLPENCVIVNPALPSCTFASRNLAGVGVIFYVLFALRAELRSRGVFDERNQPRLDTLLDLVALGTVADVVRLDRNNRILVAQGIRRIAQGRMRPGIAALFRAAGREWRNVTTQDLAFLVAPRLNAAGRMSDMSLGVECLVTDDEGRAWEIARELNEFNIERREKESGMREDALAMLEDFQPDTQASIAVLDTGWHQGVTGILASRLKDLYFRPVFVFAPDRDGQLKGSGRSVPGFHLKDALDLIAKRHPDMISRFGGHAMAAGLTMRGDAFDTFCRAFEEVAQQQLGQNRQERLVETDGAPDDSCYSLDFIRQLDAQTWGHGFEAPLFADTFRIVNQRILKERHLGLQLEKDGRQLSGIFFGRNTLLPATARLAFRITANEYNGMTTVQLVIEHAENA